MTHHLLQMPHQPFPLLLLNVSLLITPSSSSFALSYFVLHNFVAALQPFRNERVTDRLLATLYAGL